MRKTLTAVGICLVLGILWAAVQPFMGESAPKTPSEYLFSGGVWMALSLPVIYCFLREARVASLWLSTPMCSFSFAVPFGYAAMFTAFPDLILLVGMTTVSMVILGGVYPVITHIDSPNT